MASQGALPTVRRRRFGLFVSPNGFGCAAFFFFAAAVALPLPDWPPPAERISLTLLTLLPPNVEPKPPAVDGEATAEDDDDIAADGFLFFAFFMSPIRSISNEGLRV